MFYLEYFKVWKSANVCEYSDGMQLKMKVKGMLLNCHFFLKIENALWERKYTTSAILF
jgi:hypothetical protein